MSRYCVAYISFFNNDLHQKIIEAESEIDALFQTLKISGSDASDADLSTVAELKEFAYECDGMISAIKID